MWHQELGNPRVPDPLDSMQGALLGPELAPQSAADDRILGELGGVWTEHSDDDLQARIAETIARGLVIAIGRGRMEFGPRALGSRSILADARLPQMQTHLNLKIKFREGFRPFAPMVLAEDATDYFDARQDSPYMLLAYPVVERRRLLPTTAESERWGIDLLKVPRSDIPAVTHVDYSARIQTVDAARNPFMHGVLTRFKEITGCSVIVNTSFNVRGEPIVCTAEDAYRCFMATEIDALVVGNRYFERQSQKRRPANAAERESWRKRFDPD